MDPWSALVALYGATAQLASMVHQRKTRPENLEKHPARRRLVRFVEKHPGARLKDVCEELKIDRGTATYHLHLLEDSGVVDGFEGGNRHHFFPPGLKDDTKRWLALLRGGRVLEVVTTIREEPGIIQKEIHARVDVSQRMLRTYLIHLEEEGLVHVKRQWRRHHYYPTDRLETLVERLGD